MYTITNGAINETVWGANYPHYSVISTPTICRLSHHLIAMWVDSYVNESLCDYVYIYYYYLI